MLRELRIENLLLIERAELRLGPGLNAITGETGAGKTVLAHSLDLLTGGKAKAGIVRPGAAEAWVEGTFDLPAGLAERDPELAEVLERLPEGADEVTLGRRVSASGRTSAFIGGRAANAGELARLGSHLLAFYGQHQHRQLTIASAQMEILDGFGGAAQLELRERYRLAYRRRRQLAAELAELRASEGARERDLDLHRFELEEIEAAAPDPDQKRDLVEERERLRHVEKLREAAALAGQGLDGGDGASAGAHAAALTAADALARAKGVDENLDRLAERAASLALELEDLAAETRAYLAGLEADPARLAAVEERLALLDRLERKHGGDLEAVLAHAERCRELIASLEGGESRERELAAELERAELELAERAGELSRMRREAAAGLERKVAAELAELAMDGAELSVELLPLQEGCGPSGAERIEFRLAANAGMERAPLREAASGGELSRVMLALTGLAASDGARLRVFDEIDAGIGGETATVVGEKLRRIGQEGQVLAITHLPQVASQAAVHLRVAKDAAADPARATVERLSGEAIVDEIRRMLGAGAGDETATRHARELVGAAAGRTDMP